jgi:hypothetical protein
MSPDGALVISVGGVADTVQLRDPDEALGVLDIQTLRP